MLSRIGRLFVLKTRWEAWAVIYVLALGSVERGSHYLERFPGVGGWLLFLACTGVIFVAGAKLLDATRGETGERRRSGDPVSDIAPPLRSRRRAPRTVVASNARSAFAFQDDRSASGEAASHKRLIEGARQVS